MNLNPFHQSTNRPKNLHADIGHPKGGWGREPAVSRVVAKRTLERGSRTMRLLHLALGGCFTGPPVPFGLTEDTGGHVAYVMGAAAAQSAWPGVVAVDVATRLFVDPHLGARFAQPEERLTPHLRILRIATADRRYLSKGALAADVHDFAEALIARLRREGLHYDLVHAHFADAAAVAAKLQVVFGLPFIYHSHSLGLDKASQVIACAALSWRIAGEDAAIGRADGIVASSRDELLRQLPTYPSARPARILRVPPGIDRAESKVDMARAERLVAPFLRQPGRRLIVAVARPVARKNLAGLLDIYASSAVLRRLADLVLLAGLRDDPEAAEPEQAEVFRGLFARIDRHDLYGHVALPKRHERQDVFALYQLAARTGGVFAQPAFCEPYGLTIAEAAAEGLPVVATDRGGAADIVADLGCGRTADPRDRQAFAGAIEALFTDAEAWREASRTGRERAAKHSWQAWARPVMALTGRLVARSRNPVPRAFFVSDMDGTLTGSRPAAARFAEWRARHPDIAFAVATGRDVAAARRVLKAWALPAPDILITGAGAEIFHRMPNGGYAPDEGWADWAAQGWRAEAVTTLLDASPGLMRQPAHEQRALKRSWFSDAAAASTARARLRTASLEAKLIHSHLRCLDALPIRAGKGEAMRWCADAWRIPHEACFAAGDAGNDAEMLTAAAGAILVANHDDDLRHLRDAPHVHVSRERFADGVLDGLRQFLPDSGHTDAAGRVVRSTSRDGGPRRRRMAEQEGAQSGAVEPGDAVTTGRSRDARTDAVAALRVAP